MQKMAENPENIESCIQSHTGVLDKEDAVTGDM